MHFSENLSVMGRDFEHGKAWLDLYIREATLMEGGRWIEGTGMEMGTGGGYAGIQMNRDKTGEYL